MYDEKNIIDIINKRIPSNANRETACYGSDAERLKFNGGHILLTTDEFSKEDWFPETNPYTLGWNIAAGSITDIIATGGTPLYYAHALCVSTTWTKLYLQQFCDGINDVLQMYNMSFAGGDIGIADHFRCTVTIIGKPSTRTISRMGAEKGDGIYVTGRIGGGNANAAITMFQDMEHLSQANKTTVTQFAIRNRETPIIRKFASSCIDTSDGAFCGINTIADLNQVGYAIDNLPFLEKGVSLARQLSLPVELLFFGECGEYELLFTIPAEHESQFKEETLAQNFAFTRIGHIMSSYNTRTIVGKTGEFSVQNPHVSAREYANTKDYLTALIDWIDKCKQESS